MNTANQSLPNYTNTISFLPTGMHKKLIDWFVDWANRRTTLVYLHGLSERELQDIGLTPRQLAKISK